ncbi:DUF3558 domain-containing protein [Actinopolyspora xinjiangensis]|uniref:DUF3558 domain-containing protein n=1 Tax=Actinopolyspora xinjiangensis TaxID=405564 RepID=UPI000B8383ED|nr:DUF3558 domain-containing protein [Actinopolyspora xinjiangensis]
MSKIRHLFLAASCLVLGVVLAACSFGSSGGGVSGNGADSEDGVNSTPPFSKGSGVDVSTPKNATGVDVCELLSPEAATQLGIKPSGERRKNDLDPDVEDSCKYGDSLDGDLSVSLAAFDDRQIASYYENKAIYKIFEKISISGHSAVVAAKQDPMKSGTCSVFLASKRDQVVGSVATVAADDTGKKDPCVPAKKALKLSLPSWPAAK